MVPHLTRAAPLLQESRGIEPDVHTYTALIGGCAQAQQPELAAHLVGARMALMLVMAACAANLRVYTRAPAMLP